MTYTQSRRDRRAKCGGCSAAAEALESRLMLSAAPPRQVIGYLPGYLSGRDYDTAVYDAIRTAALAEVTRLNVFALIAQPSGAIPPLDMQPNMVVPAEVDQTVAEAHAHHVLVGITIGGAGSDAYFPSIASSETSRQTFISDAVQFATEHHFDSIDLDYEQPTTDQQVTDYGTLIGEMHTALAPLGISLSLDVFYNHYDIPASVIPDIDFIEIMGYDGPLGSPSSFSDAKDSLTFWSNYGVPPDKIVLGVPFFGLSSTSYAQELNYGTIQDQYSAAHGQFLDADQDSATLNGTEYDFNGITTLQQKTQYVYANGFGGVMVFDVTQDHFDSQYQYDAVSLLPAIRAVADQYTAPLTGAVFNDANNNGVRDAGEAGLGGRTVFLDLNGNGALDAGEPTAVTTSDGVYLFNGLVPGNYSLGEVVPGTYRHTTPLPNPASVTVAAPGRTAEGATFGNVPLSSVTMNFNYLLVLAQHYRQPATIAGGDLNDDGKVDFSDLLILAQNYGHGLPSVATDSQGR